MSGTLVGEDAIDACTEKEFHGNPFKYCGCGFGQPLSMSDKVDFLYDIAVKADKMLEEIAPQIGPLLAGIQKNPMLKMLFK